MKANFSIENTVKGTENVYQQVLTLRAIDAAASENVSLRCSTGEQIRIVQWRRENLGLEAVVLCQSLPCDIGVGKYAARLTEGLVICIANNGADLVTGWA